LDEIPLLSTVCQLRGFAACSFLGVLGESAGAQAKVFFERPTLPRES
jgi:hypothetical protein